MGNGQLLPGGGVIAGWGVPAGAPTGQARFVEFGAVVVADEQSLLPVVN